MQQGYVQVYTGKGKGKTTASLGLALRAVCAGYKVLMIQFVKGSTQRAPSSELKAAQYLPNFTIEQYGYGCLVARDAVSEDLDGAEKALKRLKEAVSSGEYDVVIADEINIALHHQLVALHVVLELLERRHPGTELILTGRHAPAELIDRADLVTEMTEIKHYFKQGVASRVGIEK